MIGSLRLIFAPNPSRAVVLGAPPLLHAGRVGLKRLLCLLFAAYAKAHHNSFVKTQIAIRVVVSMMSPTSG
jgi:hypothetical protein